MADILTLSGYVLDLGLQVTNSIAVPGLCGLVALDIKLDQSILHIGDERALFVREHVASFLSLFCQQQGARHVPLPHGT